MKKLFLLSLLFVSSLFARELDYFNALEKKAQVRLGGKYAMEHNSFIKSPSFNKYKSLFEKRDDKKINAKLTLKVLPYVELFKVLKSLDKESDSVIPSYHAYNLMFLSYGPHNKKINISYGEYFSDSLIRNKMCEGYVWGGLMYEKERETWERALSLFKQAVSICTESSLKERASMSLSRLAYLLSQKNKTKKSK